MGPNTCCDEEDCFRPKLAFEQGLFSFFVTQGHFVQTGGLIDQNLNSASGPRDPTDVVVCIYLYQCCQEEMHPSYAEVSM